MNHHWFTLFLTAGSVLGQGGATFQGMNPNIGVIGDFSYRDYLDGSEENKGFEFHEAEISFRMVIDPFARADFFVAVAPPEETVELEEGFVTLLALPFSLQARVGHFRNAFGKYNLTHPPETALTTLPLFLSNYFGEEGLAETGISVSALLSNPWDYFLEASVEILQGENDISFGGGRSGEFLYLPHLKSFLVISEDNTLELGLSAVEGPNDSTGNQRTLILGADAIYRWKPLALGRYRSFTLQSEVLHSRRGTSDGLLNSTAFFLFSQYQLSKRWFMGLSYDSAGFPDRGDDREERISLVTTFWPSEFQTIKIQVLRTERNFSSPRRSLAFHFRWTFVIGAHGAHKF